MDNNRYIVEELDSDPIIKRPDSISILTFNIWFDDRNLKERTSRIIDIISRHKPDLVCLQEVTSVSFKLIKHKLHDYEIFQVFEELENPYGCCILTKIKTIEVVDPYYYDYPDTNMHRRIVGCEVKIRDTNYVFHVLTTHLESGSPEKDIRNRQFDIINEVIKDLENVIIAGDFNICSNSEPVIQKIQKGNLSDCWVKMGCPSMLEYTYNGVTNQNIVGKTKSRLDRILYKTSISLDPCKMLLVGTGQTNTEIYKPPSDHYGLLSNFVLP